MTKAKEPIYRSHAIKNFGISEATADRIIALGERVGLEIYAEPGAGGGLGLLNLGSMAYIVEPAPGGRWRLTAPYRSEITYRTPTGALRTALKGDRLLRRPRPYDEMQALRAEIHRRRQTMPDAAFADLEVALGKRFKPGTIIHPNGTVVHRIEDPSGDRYDATERDCGFAEHRFAARFLRLHPAGETMPAP